MTSIPVTLDSFRWKTRSSAEAAFRAILRDSGYAIDDTKLLTLCTSGCSLRSSRGTPTLKRR